MRMPWDTDYLHASGFADSGFLHLLLSKPERIGLSLKSVDRSYRLLSEKMARAFFAANVNVCNSFKYGSNLKSNLDSFPDCDDFAYAALGQVIAAAVRLGFDACPAVGYLEYEPSWAVGSRHAALFVVIAPCTVMVYEPQTGRFKNWGEEVKSVYRGELV